MKIATITAALLLTVSTSALALGPGGGGGAPGTPDGPSGGGGASSGGAGAGPGGSGSSGSGSGASDLSIYGGRPTIGGLREGSWLLTPNQEYTWDMFTECKRGKDVQLHALRFDGSFTFSADLTIDMTRTVDCLRARGFGFNQ